MYDEEKTKIELIQELHDLRQRLANQEAARIIPSNSPTLNLDGQKEQETEYKGREVSCRALGILFDGLKKRGLSAEILAANSNYSLTHLQNKHEHISWPSFCIIMANAGKVWRDSELIELGSTFFRSPWSRPIALVAHLLYTPMDFYRVAASPGPRSGRQFTCVQPFMQELGSNQLVYTIKLDEGYKPSREFWLISQGVLAAMPTVMGLPIAQVQMTSLDDGVQYRIQLPSGGGVLAWFRRAVTWPFTALSTARELEEVNIELQKQYLNLQRQMADREKAELEVQETRSMLMTAIENMREGFALFDANGRLILCNEQYKHTYPKIAEFIEPGVFFVDLVKLSAERHQIEEVSGMGDKTYYDVRMNAWSKGEILVYKTSEGRWIEARDNTLLGGGRISIRIDITHRKRAEAELEMLVTELERKNAELEQFTYTVSHDLKSPLVTIKGFLGYLRHDIEKGDQARIFGDIARIQAATEQMHLLLNDLLTLSQIGRVINSPQFAPFNNLVEEALEIVAGSHDEGNITISVMDNMPVVYVDRSRIVEVLQNLLDNAAKFMGKQEYPHVEIGVMAEEREPVFFVRDNGNGIEARYHEKVFDLFERLDGTTQGTGIGLALVKRIIQAHNGRIWLESDGRTGTTFYFTLPTKAS